MAQWQSQWVTRLASGRLSASREAEGDAASGRAVQRARGRAPPPRRADPEPTPYAPGTWPGSRKRNAEAGRTPLGPAAARAGETARETRESEKYANDIVDI